MLVSARVFWRVHRPRTSSRNTCSLTRAARKLAIMYISVRLIRARHGEGGCVRGPSQYLISFFFSPLQAHTCYTWALVALLSLFFELALFLCGHLIFMHAIIKTMVNTMQQIQMHFKGPCADLQFEPSNIFPSHFFCLLPLQYMLSGAYFSIFFHEIWPCCRWFIDSVLGLPIVTIPKSFGTLLFLDNAREVGCRSVQLADEIEAQLRSHHVRMFSCKLSPKSLEALKH